MTEPEQQGGNDMVTLNIRRVTKDKFLALGKYGMSQDDIQNALIDFWQRYKGVVES